MRIYRRGLTWYAEYYTKNNRRVQTSTRCRDRAAAEIKARELERQAQTLTAQETLKACFEAYLHHHSPRIKPETVTYTIGKMGPLLRILGERCPITSISPAMIDRYIDQRRAEEVKDTTIHKEMIPLFSSLKYAARRGVYSGNIEALKPTTLDSTYVPVDRYLTREQLPKLMAAIGPQMRACIAFSIATGANVREMHRARPEDLGDDFVHLRGTKTRLRDRIVPIVTTWQKELLAIAKECHTTIPPIFRPKNSTYRLNLASEKCLGIKLSWNDFRRTYASWMLQDGAHPSAVARSMGHSTSAMVERVYGKMTAQDLADLLKKQLRTA